MTDDPLRIPIAHSVRYVARGLPDVPNQYGRGVLRPSEITLNYRAAPDSQLGRVHAYVAGRLWADGAEIPLLNDGLYGQHYDDGLDGWPEWLAEEARLHDPDVAPADRAASTAPLAAGLPLVQGRCPACQRASLFLGSGGYVTCSSADCPEPDAATTVLEGGANWPAVRAAILREAADIAESLRQFKPAFGARNSAQVSENVGILRVADELRRKADEAEYVATPCSPPNVCEDGGEPCSTHERLMAHAEGDHELCGPDCGTSPSRTAGDGLAATTCSAQYHGHGETRLCIRAAQHTGKAHADEHGFHWSDTVAVYPLAAGQFRTGINVRAELRRMADEAQQPETQAAVRAAIIAELLPAWEAVYEPGNVSDYLIGYANDEAPAKAAAEAWMRSQAEVTGRLEWVPEERLATGRYDQWFELVERHADGIDTGPGLIVRRRVAVEAQPDLCSGCRYVPCGNCPTAVVSQPGKEG